MNRKLIVANWKMNTTLPEAVILANGIKTGIRDLVNVQAVLCPPFPWLTAVKDALADRPVKQLALGAQNIFWQEKGAYTGEVSAPMLKGLVQYVIIGHSERRKFFKESNEEINQKIRLTLSYGMIPILCVGELKKPTAALLEDPSPLTASSIRSIMTDLDEGLAGLSPAEVQHVVIAYEPVWAISGHGQTVAATGAYAEKVTSLITEHMAKMTKQKSGTTVLYGGSVSADNAHEFLGQPHVGGLLVGGASLKTESFVAICRAAHQTK